MVQTNGIWKKRLIGAGITLITAAVIASFGFAWSTNAQMAIIQTEMANLKADVGVLKDQSTTMLNLISSGDGTDGIQDVLIGTNTKTIDEHKQQTVGAHQ